LTPEINSQPIVYKDGRKNRNALKNCKTVIYQFHFKGNVVAEPLLCAYPQVSAEHRLPLVYPNVESLIETGQKQTSDIRLNRDYHGSINFSKTGFMLRVAVQRAVIVKLGETIFTVVPGIS
jgi:hypothetical protein